MRRAAEALFGLDPRSLALFRALLGATLFADTLAGMRGLGVFFTDSGVLPREAAARLAEATVGLSAHFLDGSLAAAALLSLLTSAAALAFAVGYRTRSASIALFFLVLSAQIRDPLVLQGSDYIARVLLFWALFLPLGERASVDAIRSPQSAPRRGVILSAATAGLTIQVAMIYWASAALKTDDPWRETRTAVYYVLNVPSIATPLGRLVGEHPDLCRALTYATVGIETFGPALLFVPLSRGAARLAAVLLFTAFHVALHLCMRLGPFSYVAIAMWMAFLPGVAWDGLARRERARRLTSWIDRRARPAPVDALAAPIQQKLSSIQPALRHIAGALSFAALVLLLWLNAGVLLGRSFAPPRSVIRASLGFGLNQEWGMFAPGPPQGDTWLVFEGTLDGGRAVDALGDGAPVDWDRPLPSPFPGSPGENYTSSITEALYARERRYLARWICRRWDAARSSDPLRTIRIRLVVQEVPLPGLPAPPKTSSVLWEQACSE